MVGCLDLSNTNLDRVGDEVQSLYETRLTEAVAEVRLGALPWREGTPLSMYTDGRCSGGVRQGGREVYPGEGTPATRPRLRLGLVYIYYLLVIW